MWKDIYTNTVKQSELHYSQFLIENHYGNIMITTSVWMVEVAMISRKLMKVPMSLALERLNFVKKIFKFYNNY